MNCKSSLHADVEGIFAAIALICSHSMILPFGILRLFAIILD